MPGTWLCLGDGTKPSCQHRWEENHPIKLKTNDTRPQSQLLCLPSSHHSSLSRLIYQMLQQGDLPAPAGSHSQSRPWGSHAPTCTHNTDTRHNGMARTTLHSSVTESMQQNVSTCRSREWRKGPPVLVAIVDSALLHGDLTKPTDSPCTCDSADWKRPAMR